MSDQLPAALQAAHRQAADAIVSWMPMCVGPNCLACASNRRIAAHIAARAMTAALRWAVSVTTVLDEIETLDRIAEGNHD